MPAVRRFRQKSELSDSVLVTSAVEAFGERKADDIYGSFPTAFTFVGPGAMFTVIISSRLAKSRS